MRWHLIGVCLFVLAVFYLLLLKMIFICSSIVSLQCSVNFLPYCQVTQPHTHTHTHTHTLFLTFSSIMLHHKCLDIVPSAIQQDLTAYPFQRQQFASMNSRFPVHPTPFPSLLATTSLFSRSMIFYSVEKFICAVYQIPDISVSYGICLSDFTSYESLYHTFFLISSFDRNHNRETTATELLFLFYFILFYFRAAGAAYESSQARGRIRAATAGLRHSPETPYLSHVWNLYQS